MLKARPAKEVIVKLQNEVGALDRIARAISDKGVDILATSSWVDGDQAIVHVVTDDNLRVVGALEAQGFHPREADAIVMEVPHKSGMLRHVTHKLAQEGIDIHHLYATTLGNQERCLFVFATANNDRAVVVLNG